MRNNYLFLLILLIHFSFISCGGRGPEPENEKTVNPPILPPTTPLDATVKIYFENTLSMDGYIKGNTGFKDILRDLLIAVDNENEIDLETEFYLVNNKLTPTDFGGDHTKIAEKLTPGSTINKGDKGSSNFEEILNTVLESQKGDVISIVMADFIYSPEGESDTPSALNKLRTYTQDAFIKAARANKNLETTIYQFDSDFNGLYYDIDNIGISGIKTRPYYLIVTAPAELMTVFAHKIAPQLKKAPGYKNEAIFTASNFNEISAQILTATGNKGRLKARGQELEVVSYPNNGKLEFIVLVDFTALPVNNKYLLDETNYTIENPEFAVKEIGEVNGKNLEFTEQATIKMNPSTLVKIKDSTFTHAILFEADGIVSEDLKFSLKKRIPGWVENVHSENDKQIGNDSLEQTRTFGFGHLAEGISRAYELQGGNDEYFNITIPVK